MARPAFNLRAFISMSFLTWLAIAMVAMPVASAGAVADFDNQDMAQTEMPMSCDHGDGAGTAASRYGHVDGQDRQPCCADCDMPDCAAGSAGPVLTILTGTIPEAFLSNNGTPNLLGDLTHISIENHTPRKPPRV
ncbi:hypothetical protein [Hyphobacterium marinum]|jgi:hypothetical protein|uniref:DUF2946 domain-containing protein n=1 Tax=Hyphobacterium marinum TaxID=3116574 RepID=A0ABU7LUA7_9PROT|nr:hypothetical protein [Hyphobacterium sp. Y6023]MEE2565132.1 hypothetical protein [Hyphobacterium sp. Y6023]|tara:strand:+ start:1582 stop:1986 length:405 start_codon:yes stop_codon:yes gene_type:complete